MEEIRINDFSQGWIASDDSYNGRKNGLLVMKNLQLDENGALTITPGYSKINGSTFGGSIHTIYSQVFGNGLYRYVATTAGHVYRSALGGIDPWTRIIDSTGSTTKTAFSTGLGQVFICSGASKYKDDSINTTLFGPTRPTAKMVLVDRKAPEKDVTGTYANYKTTSYGVEGTITLGADYIQIVPASGTNRGATCVIESIDANAIGGVVGTGKDDDDFILNVRISDSSLTSKIRIEFLMQEPTASSNNDITDYYYYEWDIADGITTFRLGINQWNALTCKRRDFTYVGGTVNGDWSLIKAVRIIVEVTSLSGVYDNTYLFNNFHFAGGVIAPLNGTYRYLQVNCRDTSSYIANSGADIDLYAETIPLVKSYMTVTPQDPTDDQVNLIRIYRSEITGVGSPRYLLVKELEEGNFGTFDDQMSDDDAQLQNIELNLHLEPLSSISDDIIGIAGPVAGRYLLLTAKDVYLTEPDNIDSYDARYTIKISDSSGEKNLFITQVSNSFIVIGTTAGMYELSGTFTEIDVGNETLIMDVVVRNLGVKHPPISDAFAVDKNLLFYIASDGIRYLSGNDTNLLVDNIDLLYKGVSRYEEYPVVLGSSATNEGELAISKGKLYCQVLLDDGSGTRTLHRYDFLRKSWDHYEVETQALWTEQDDTLLAGIVEDLYVLNYGVLDQAISLLTPKFAGEKPKCRKDAYTMRIKAYTGGHDLTVHMIADGSEYSIGILNRLSHDTTQDFDLSGILVKDFQIKIYGTTDEFILNDVAIFFDSRPEQLTYFKFQNSDFGTPARKDASGWPINIDTLGNSVIFTPYLDNVAGTPTTITNVKKTLVECALAAVGTFEFGFTITGGPFELWEPEKLNITCVYPIQISEYYSKTTNCGTDARKDVSYWPLVINTLGHTLTFTPYADGVAGTPYTFSNTDKRTVRCPFDATGKIDFKYNLTGGLFELWEPGNPNITLTYPKQTRLLQLPANNLGTHARKDVSGWPIVIDTLGVSITFTSYVDGVASTVTTINTNGKTTVRCDLDAIGAVDFGAVLYGGPFELWDAMAPHVTLKYPEPATYVHIPNNDFGIDALKEFANCPLSIDALGNDVTIENFLDDDSTSFTYPNHTGKRVIDNFVYGHAKDLGIIISGGPFELWKVLEPLILSTHPVGRLVDSIGPIPFTELGTLTKFRYRCIASDYTLRYEIFADGVSKYNGTINTIINADKFYEVMLPKGISGTVLEIKFGPTDNPFYRYQCELKVSITGEKTENKLITIK